MVYIPKRALTLQQQQDAIAKANASWVKGRKPHKPNKKWNGGTDMPDKIKNREVERAVSAEEF